MTCLPWPDSAAASDSIPRTYDIDVRSSALLRAVTRPTLLSSRTCSAAVTVTGVVIMGDPTVVQYAQVTILPQRSLCDAMRRNRPPWLFHPTQVTTNHIYRISDFHYRAEVQMLCGEAHRTAVLNLWRRPPRRDGPPDGLRLILEILLPAANRRPLRQCTLEHPQLLARLLLQPRLPTQAPRT